MNGYLIALIIVCILFIPVFLVGFVLGINHRIKKSEAIFGSADAEAKRIIADGEKAAEIAKKEAILSAKEENARAKKELENEIKERRAEISKLEKRCVDREEAMDKKLERLEQRDDLLRKKIEETEQSAVKVEEIKAEQLAKLEKLSGLTSSEAKAELVQNIEDEARSEAASKLLEIEARLKEESDEKAKEIICTAMQRCASDYVAEATVSVVPLPNDEVKGRIIGREGRNIRTLEQLTGVDLIIDDTPEAITLSSFDPVRREIARLSLEKLVADGRIHPARIEDIVEKAKKEVDVAIKQAGERAVLDTGLHGINTEIIKVLGRLRYRTSYGQNVLAHSIEVAYISGIIAGEVGADINMAKRAGLLHDIGKATSQEQEGSHAQIGVDLAKKYKEKTEIIHAIEAHHGDVEARTAIAVIVQIADALSAARPGARRENVENFIKRLQRLEEIANEINGVEKSFAIQAGREVRVIVKPEVIDDKAMILVARDIARKIENELKYPGQIKVNIIRESRASDIAK